MYIRPSHVDHGGLTLSTLHKTDSRPMSVLRYRPHIVLLLKLLRCSISGIVIVFVSIDHLRSILRKAVEWCIRIRLAFFDQPVTTRQT